MIAALVFSLQFKSVQTYVAKRAARYLSDELHTRVEIKSLYVKPFKSVVLEGLYVQDLQKDTLLYSPEFILDLNFLSLKQRRISVNTVQMDNGKFYLKDFKDNTNNLDFIIDYFDSGTTKPKTKRRPYEITFDKIVLNNLQFKYKNFKYNDTVSGVDFNNILVQNLNTTVTGLNTKDHLASFRIKNLTLREKSGFYLKTLNADAVIDSNTLEFKNLLLQTKTTRITDYVQFKFSRFGDFNHFVKKVHVKANFTNARINSRDIAYFLPDVRPATFDVRADGYISGYVDNFKAKNFSLKAGQATYLKGDIKITGLPKLSETFLDLTFDQVYSNKKDAEFIIKSFTGKTQKLPEIIQKFGNVNFKGHFTGFTNDFIANGEFKTSLGRIVSDVNMKIISGSPVYSGSVKTFDFNIGELLNEKTLGRVSMATSLKGAGFELNKLKENIESSITYLDFKGYRYTNIKVNGIFNRKMFNGKVTVSDRNLGLDFRGGFDLNPALPVFNFDASIRNANLHKLNLLKDTLQIDADFTTNFKGNDLNNIEGDLELKHIRLTGPQKSVVVDSVYLAAEGTGSQRTLVVNSDILDASIKGQYDLNTLPDYFKSVAKRYIPSLNTGPLTPGIQNFEFDLKLKYSEPLSLLFAPEIKVPEGAAMHGKFQSQSNVNTFNGSAKLVTYNNVKINDLIIDQTNSEKALNIFITSDRIDINDSLYVKNINVANFIQNDSLNLNVKLSDKDAVNQLDLNGLVEFGKDTSATLSLLPSDLIINRESWKIQEKVRIGFDNGKVAINNFQLFRDNQLLSINGIISNSSEDHLKIDFSKFKLTTFNSLTHGFGINMRGELNGNIAVAAAGKTPHIDAALKIDSMVFNNTLVGDLVFDAGFDNETKLIDARISVLKLGKETLNLDGTYNARATENNLDMAVKMNESELIIFEPFIKNLVSKLTGTASADLRLTGSLSDPKINGNLSLNNAGMVVNYLKTPYHINDKVSVENSVIKLDNLVIRDVNNHEAIANGTVNMNNPNTPDINVVVVANNFMALNTTGKDNSVYYGTAYGSGTFRFNGPTDNMIIDIEAETKPGTVFNIPLNSASRVGTNEFITFVAKDSSLTPKKQNSFNGVTMSFRLNINDGTEVNIFTDLGVLTGRGNSDLRLNITSAGVFEMFGNYLISSGKFNFTSNDFISKNFDIKNGGSIKWTGDPTQAAINLSAVYSLRPSLKPLYVAAGQPPVEEQRVLTEATMNLSETLLHPKISFAIEFPSNPYIKDDLGGYFSNETNVSIQALNLILRRSFTPGNGADLKNEVEGTVTSAVYEVFFNQVNNIISKSLGLKFVDFNIRSLNDASASFKFFNDRLIITGGVADRRDISDISFLGNQVYRDVEAQYLIKRDGTLSFKASNRLNSRSTLTRQSTSDQYVSALGLVYRQDFDNLDEFLRILIGKKRKEDRRKESEQKQATPLIVPPATVKSQGAYVPAKTGSR